MATTITQGRKRDAQSYLYSWVGQDKTGKAVRGEMRANGQNVVVAQLRRQGLSYIKVKKQRIGTGRKITEKDIAIFTRQLAVMMRAGVPLLQAFDIVGKGHSNASVQKMLLAIKTDVATGSSLNQAFRKFPDQFDDLFCNLVRAGEVVGEIALLDGHPRTADAVADTDGEVMLLERRDLLPLLAENGAFALALMDVLCERLRQTSAQVEALMFQEMGPRIARALLQLSQVQRLASVAVTQKQLGEMAGTSRESANRTLKAWEAKGLVSLVPGRVTLRDERAIRAIAEGAR